MFARHQILLNWKDADPPSLTRWMRELLHFLKLENIKHSQRSATKIFYKGWDPFVRQRRLNICIHANANCDIVFSLTIAINSSSHYYFCSFGGGLYRLFLLLYSFGFSICLCTKCHQIHHVEQYFSREKSQLTQLR